MQSSIFRKSNSSIFRKSKSPLSHTDPSGFSVDDAFFPMWAAVVIGTIATFATAGMAAPAAAAVALIGFAAGFTGAVVGAAEWGIIWSGNDGWAAGRSHGGYNGRHDIWCRAAFSPMLTREAGQLVLNMKNVMVSLGQAGAHGVVNGGFRVIQGSRFEHGFMSGFFASLSASGVGMIKNAPLGLYAIVGAATGGTAEALGGGKFANGAVTGAFVGMFNHGMHGGNDEYGGLTKKEFYLQAVNGMELPNGDIISRDDIYITFNEDSRNNALYLGTMDDGKHHMNFSLGDYSETADNIRGVVVHELYGHGIKGYCGGTTRGGTHYKAYFAQVDSKYWGFSTSSYKRHVVKHMYNKFYYETGSSNMPNKYLIEYHKYINN